MAAGLFCCDQRYGKSVQGLVSSACAGSKGRGKGRTAPGLTGKASLAAHQDRPHGRCEKEKRKFSIFCLTATRLSRRYTSSRPHRLAGPGQRPFTPSTGVQIPLGTPIGNQGTCSDASAFFVAVLRVGPAPFFTCVPPRPSLLFCLENAFPPTQVLLSSCAYRFITLHKEHAPKKEKPQESLEKQLWSAADKLRKNIGAAEYKHVVLGLICRRRRVRGGRPGDK